MENEVSPTRDVSQWKQIEIEVRFRRRIYFKFISTKITECQIC
jgi:hypothetical protein